MNTTMNTDQTDINTTNTDQTDINTTNTDAQAKLEAANAAWEAMAAFPEVREALRLQISGLESEVAAQAAACAAAQAAAAKEAEAQIAQALESLGDLDPVLVGAALVAAGLAPSAVSGTSVPLTAEQSRLHAAYQAALEAEKEASAARKAAMRAARAAGVPIRGKRPKS